MNTWIQHPGLWDKAMKKAADELPKWTASFWRRVKALYEDLGGGYVMEELDFEEGVDES